MVHKIVRFGERAILVEDKSRHGVSYRLFTLDTRIASRQKYAVGRFKEKEEM
jgi:hypothetical protein